VPLEHIVLQLAQLLLQLALHATLEHIVAPLPQVVFHALLENIILIHAQHPPLTVRHVLVAHIARVALPHVFTVLQDSGAMLMQQHAAHVQQEITALVHQAAAQSMQVLLALYPKGQVVSYNVLLEHIMILPAEQLLHRVKHVPLEHIVLQGPLLVLDAPLVHIAQLLLPHLL